MRILLLSSATGSHGTCRIKQAMRAAGHKVHVMKPGQLRMLLGDGPALHTGRGPLKRIDLVVPRINTVHLRHAATLIDHLQLMGVRSTISAEALLASRDKYRALQRLSHAGIPIPRTAFAGTEADAGQLVHSVGGAPCIIKLLDGTHGKGVILAHGADMATSIIDGFHRSRIRVLVQEFIQESAGSDLRAFVVGDRVVAAMRRTGPVGDFRSNLHGGGTAVPVELDARCTEVALAATRAMDMAIAGVDILLSARGPLVIEVNNSPGLEGIEKATGQDIAGEIVRFIERHI